MIQIIVADIDNTLTAKHKDITLYTKETIKKIQANHIYFGLASGRPIGALQALEEKWGIQAELLIGDNGSEYYDGLTHQQQAFYQMKKEWLKQAVEIMESFDTNIYLRVGKDVYFSKEDVAANQSKSYAKEDLNYHLIQDTSELYQREAAKIGFRVNESDMPAIEKKVKDCQLKGFMGLKTEKNMYEFCHAQASKGALLQAFCQTHGIEMKDVCSFGDLSNDISLFQVSGVSVCMLNGSDDAKKAAKYITDKTVDEDGFADYVNRYILR